MKSLDIKTIAKKVIQIEAEAVSQIQKQINEDFEKAVNAFEEVGKSLNII